MSTKTYAESGVSHEQDQKWLEKLKQAHPAVLGDLQKKVKSNLGAYAAVYALSDEKWIATCCDGVGTKLLWTLAGLGRYEDLAQDLLAMNANDLLCVGARPLLFLDYMAIGSADLLGDGAPMDKFITGLRQACAKTAQLLVGGETAQMPDLYQKDHFDLAGFSIGELAKEEYLDASRIEEGASVWGWTSSGPHSNGYTWLRKLFDQKQDADFIKKELMQPTRLYVNEVAALKKLMGTEVDSLQGFFHMTGGGLNNLLRLARPDDSAFGFDLCDWPKQDPLWVQAVREKSGASEKELFASFNMGFGMLCVLQKDWAKNNQVALQALGLCELGKVTSEKTVKCRDLCFA